MYTRWYSLWGENSEGDGLILAFPRVIIFPLVFLSLFFSFLSTTSEAKQRNYSFLASVIGDIANKTCRGRSDFIFYPRPMLYYVSTIRSRANLAYIMHNATRTAQRKISIIYLEILSLRIKYAVIADAT